MSALAPFYRLYELPWSPTEEVERRFRKVVRNAFIVFAVFAILLGVWPGLILNWIDPSVTGWVENMAVLKP